MTGKPELAILTFKRDELTPWHRRAARGDPEAVKFFDEMWDGHARPLACFLDDNPIDGTPFSLVLPDGRNADHVMIVPLCDACRALPALKRWGRAIKLLKWLFPGSHYRLGS
jgi:hypothetical protein